MSAQVTDPPASRIDGTAVAASPSFLGRRVRSLIDPGDLAAGALGLAIVLAVWTYGGRQGWANGFVVTPADAIRPIFGDSADVYRRATTATVWSAFRGLLIGSVLAFTAALVAAGVPALRRTITRLAAIANAAPWVAVAPCLLIVLGRESGPVAVAAIAVFFYVFISTYVGLGAAPPATHDVATALGAGRLRRVWSVQLPSAWPSVADGLKLAAPAALAGAVFGEWYGAERGLGVLLITAMQGGRADRLWAASLLSAACGLAAYALLSLVRALATRRYGASISASSLDVRTDGNRTRVVVTEFAGDLGARPGHRRHLGRVDRARGHLADRGPQPERGLRGSLEQSRRVPVGHHGDVVHGADRLRRRSDRGARCRVRGLADPLARRDDGPARRHAGRHAAGRTLPAVRPCPRLRAHHRAGPGGGPGLLPRLRLHPVGPGGRADVDARRRCRSRHLAIRALFRLVVLPSAVPHIASGLRIAAGSAVIAAVVGESLIGREGLGVEFAFAYRLLELPRAFGAALVVVAVSVLVFAAAGLVERRVHQRWA